MPALDHEHLAIARVWSDALLKLAAERGEEDALRDELAGLAALLDRQPEFDRLLSSPVVDDEAKGELIEKTLRGRASDLLVDALQVLRRKGRLEILRALARVYHQGWLERRGGIEVRVESAAPLSEERRRDLLAAISRRTGRTAELVESVNADLLGGMVVRIGDQRFDASVRAELGRVESILLDRASRELQSGRQYGQA